MSVDASARTVMERCEILASYSEEPDRLTRRFATKAMQQVNETVMAWMHAAGWQSDRALQGEPGRRKNIVAGIAS